MDLDTPENREILIRDFNKLKEDSSFKINSPDSCEYNCIAWAMGFDDRWVDPLEDDYIHKKWWPDAAPKSRDPRALVSAFECMGFELCENDESEIGCDKVALYKGPAYNVMTQRFESTVVWTHAARVISSNLYHSKMGDSFDIYHRGGNVFEGSIYGTVFAFMRRSVEKRSITEEIKLMPVEIPSDSDKERITRQILSFFTE